MPNRIAARGLAALLLGAFVSPPAGAAITGVCPDGSIFIVQAASAIPCRDAKRVEPSDVPPIQPEFLPRPYGWERFHRRADPNNPYNVIDAREGQRAAVPPSMPEPAPQAAPPMPRSAPQVAPQVAALVPPGAARAAGIDLGLNAVERANLEEIVGLLQSVAPARVSRFDAGGERRITVELAHSAAFEARVHGALARRGSRARGPVVLFRVEALAEEEFHGNLTFVQGHVAFHPDPSDPEQLGVIQGGLGRLPAGQRVLGYAVLPEHLDPSQTLDIYWNDRRITANLAGR